jgi:hypothetical protein
MPETLKRLVLMRGLPSSGKSGALATRTHDDHMPGSLWCNSARPLSTAPAAHAHEPSDWVQRLETPPRTIHETFFFRMQSRTPNSNVISFPGRNQEVVA